MIINLYIKYLYLSVIPSMEDQNNESIPIPPYNKLIRNKIPQIIKTNGKTPTTRILKEKEYIKELRKEVQEELSDLLEPINALFEHVGYNTRRNINTIRKKKAEERGSLVHGMSASNHYILLLSELLRNSIIASKYDLEWPRTSDLHPVKLKVLFYPYISDTGFFLYNSPCTSPNVTP